MKTCEHDVAAGTCMWCMAGDLEYEAQAINVLRHAYSKAERTVVYERAEKKIAQEKTSQEKPE